VLKLGAVTRGEFDDSQSKALPADLQPISKYEVRQRDVLITRGSGALGLVASCVLVKDCRTRLMLPDLIFRVLFKETSTLAPEFLAEVLRSPFVRHQIEVIALGASTTMKKVTKPTLFNLRFPLPPLPEQERIVTELDRLRTQARSARATAAASRESAAQAFHAALFAPV
jgi:type I restriction enzyme S subunit